jgi:hypothetical protein
MEDKSAKNEEKSFLKRLFNWKYLVILIVILVPLIYLQFMGGEAFKGMSLIVIGIVFYLSKRLSKNDDKSISPSMQWASFFFYTVITALIYYAVISYSMKQSSDSSKVIYVMDTMLKGKNKLPKKVTELFELFNVSKMNEHTIIQDVRYIDYTKAEVLNEYGGDIDLYKKEMTKAELQASCSIGKDMFTLGIVVINTYFGKDNQSIIRVEVNDENCRPYYAKRSK